jgi:5-methylcytosine-specific restriction protein B
MARYPNATSVYEAANLFCERCLLSDGSLLGNEPLWTAENLRRLHDAFVRYPERDARSFTETFKDQIAEAGNDAIARLAAEVVAVHFLFPSNVRGNTKRALVTQVLGWGNGALPEDSLLARAFAQGVGSGGLGYNTRRPLEIAFLIEFALEWKGLDAEQRAALLIDHMAFMAFVDQVAGADTRQLRHMLLHLVYPDYFERISSGAQKSLVAKAFSSLVRDDGEADLDTRLWRIRESLKEMLPGVDLDFYDPPLLQFWNDQGEDPVAGLSLEALRHKRQIVLYGPPGTGKTHQAKSIAERLIRPALLEVWGPEGYFARQAEVAEQIRCRTHRLQLHPAYGYEDFVRGLHIDGRGGTEYRPGYLPRLVEKMKLDHPKIPHVLILDEMNRTDLSRTLGEAFSLLEDRDQEIELPGADADGNTTRLRIPSNLFVVGTMNLIDQSVEQMDFALRRRFLWVRCPFSRQALLSASESRWREAGGRIEWSVVAPDFEILARAAESLNDRISESSLLGPQYEIGHAYLLDAVTFLMDDLGRQPRTFLWATGKAKRPVEQTWELSLLPLLEEYMAGLDSRSRKSEIDKLRETFLRPTTEAD